MPTILLARHGQASFGGEDYDVLSEHGHAQAARLADELSARELSVGRLLSGSLRRQRDTAAPFAATLGCEVAVDPRFNEYDMDEILAAHSGTAVRTDNGTEQAISSRAFQDLLDTALRAWMAAGEDSPAAETWPAFTGRIDAALGELAGALAPGSTGVVFTSGGVLAAVCVSLLALPESAFLAVNRVTVNASITKVIHGRRGSTLVSFNEHGHLEHGGSSLVTYR
jgi:broad specificity phosphatase PhoE